MRTLCLALWAAASVAQAAGGPLVFPFPRELSSRTASFAVDEKLAIYGDPAVARLVMSELSDRYGVAVRMSSAQAVPVGSRAIVIGTVANPLVRRLADERKLKVTPQVPGHEGYAIDVTPGLALVAGSDDAGAFYGAQTLRQLLRRNGKAVEIAGVAIRDWPYKPFRGIKLYLPGRNNLPYFTRFVRDFMAMQKYNKLVIEVNAAMRLDRHPELNAGWLDMGRDLDATRRDRPPGPHGNSNSSHQDTADGGILEKEEVAGIVRLANENHIEVIPEIASLPHSYYLLARHPEMAEVSMQWPDTYCPLHPGSYELLFDVLDEYIDVMKPRMVQIGHDEWRMPWGLCPRCKDKDYRELFISDVTKIHEHLKKRGVRTAMWGDYLIEPLRGAGLQDKVGPSGWKYRTPGAITPEQVRTRIPKDILIFNWFWDDSYPRGGMGEKQDLQLQDWGFEQVYGNMTPEVQNYERRSAQKSVIGGAPSSWAATTEFNFGKDLMYAFLGCANMLWGTRYPGEAELGRLVQEQTEAYRTRLSGAVPPSGLDPVTPLKLESSQAPQTPPVRTGRVTAGNLVFDAVNPIAVRVEGKNPVQQWPKESATIPIGEDVSSVIFLHALQRSATNFQGYRYIYNFQDSSDLLGWYEVVYEDGLVETIPLRYKVNILEWDRFRRPDSEAYCYNGDAVELGTDPAKPVTFYAFEWRNPRYGKTIREVRLKGSSGFRQADRVIGNNGIFLAAVSVVKKRPAPAPLTIGIDDGARP